MAGGKIGSVFVELSLDDKVYKQRLGETLTSTTATAKGIEASWRALGAQSDAVFDKQRLAAQNAYTLIKSSATSTAADIARAQEALNSKLDSLNTQQYGKQTSFLEKMKANWLAATAAIGAAMAVLYQGFDLASQAAEYIEQMQLLDALAKKYDTTATSIVNSIRSAGEGMISMSKASEVAAAGLAKGLTPKMLTDLAGAAATMADFMGVKVEDAFQQFAKALETGRTRSITAAVGITEMTNATEEMTEKMTPAMKAQAAYNAIMEASKKVQDQLAGSTESIADKFEKMKVTIADLKLEMGVGLIRAGAGAAAAFEYLAAGVLGLVAAYAKFRALVYDVKAATTFGKMSQDAKALADEMRAIAEAATGARGDTLKKAADNFAIMTASTQQLTAATATGTATIKDNTKATEEQAASIAKVIPIIDQWGAVQLKMASANYAEQLKAEGATIDQMKASMESYLATIRNVYETRLAGEDKIKEYMLATKANAEEQAKAQEASLKTEQEYAQARLDAWKQYYDALVGQHKAATDKQKAIDKELDDLRKSQQAQQQTHANTMLALQEKLMVAQGKAASDYSIYLMKLKAIEAERAAANQLSGQAQIDALEKVKAKYGELTSEVTTVDKVWDTATSKWIDKNTAVITSEEAIKKAIQNVGSVQEEIVAAQEKMLAAKEAEKAQTQATMDALVQAMASAKTNMEAYQALVQNIAAELDKLKKDIAISVDDKATPAIQQIKAQLDSLQDKVVKVTIQQTTTGGGGGAKTGGVSTSNLTPYENAVLGAGEPTWGTGWEDPSAFEGAMRAYTAALEKVGATSTAQYVAAIDGMGNYYGAIESAAESSAEAAEASADAAGAAMDASEILTTSDWGSYTGGAGGLSWSDYSGGGYGGEYGSYQSGLSYVPMDNYRARLHEGEAVLTKEEANAWRAGKGGGGNVINFNPSISIVGSSKSAEQLAREIVKPLQAEMRRLAAVS